MRLMVTLLMPDQQQNPADAAQWAALGHRIAIVREDQRWSQRELARRADVSYAHIAEIERGRKKASPDVLRRIARALGVPYGEWAILVGYADAPNTVDVAYDEMRRDFEDLARRVADFAKKWGFRPGDGPTHDRP